MVSGDGNPVVGGDWLLSGKTSESWIHEAVRGNQRGNATRSFGRRRVFVAAPRGTRLGVGVISDAQRLTALGCYSALFRKIYSEFRVTIYKNIEDDDAT